MDKVGIGFIGCGNISEAYLKAAAKFPILDIRGVADLKPEAAQARASQFGLEAHSVDALLRDPAVEIIVNLTIPAAHVEVGLMAIAAGKHVHSEKPLGLTTAHARTLLEAADRRGLRVGCAPDTFLGGAHQTCRKLVVEGAIGKPVAGTETFLCRANEPIPPNTAVTNAGGVAPKLYMRAYNITARVNLIGPVARVSGSTSRVRSERLITSEPLKGTKIDVEVATHVAGTMEFASGAVVSIATSFDVPKHRHVPIELYGTEASMIVPDPNHFGGTIQIAQAGQEWADQPIGHAYGDGNYRSIGVADMAHAIRAGRPHRASGELALHVLEVMEAFETSSRLGRHVSIETRPERPHMLPTAFSAGALG